MGRQRDGTPQDSDEVTLSHAVSRGVASASPRAVRGAVLAGAVPGVAAAMGATPLAAPCGWTAWLASAATAIACGIMVVIGMTLAARWLGLGSRLPAAATAGAAGWALRGR